MGVRTKELYDGLDLSVLVIHLHTLLFRVLCYPIFRYSEAGEHLWNRIKRANIGLTAPSMI